VAEAFTRSSGSLDPLARSKVGRTSRTGHRHCEIAGWNAWQTVSWERGRHGPDTLHRDPWHCEAERQQRVAMLDATSFSPEGGQSPNLHLRLLKFKRPPCDGQEAESQRLA
jgi:hypothetical protein